MVIKNLLRTSAISRQTVVLYPRKIKHLQEDQQLKEEQKMNITYHEENGYLLPNIVVGCDTSRPIGKYGRMRRKYLQEHRPVLFSVMVQDGALFEHLAEVKDAAQSGLETLHWKFQPWIILCRVFLCWRIQYVEEKTNWKKLQNRINPYLSILSLSHAAFFQSMAFQAQFQPV